MSDPDYICDFCSRSFTRKYNLQTHIENCHLNMSCHCAICDAGFGSPTGLALHLSRGHNSFNQGFPECDLCGRVFTRRQNIINHMINVHLQTNPLFSCHLCDKTFTTERNMKRHLNILHNPAVACLRCNYCLRIFRGRDGLIAHIQSHERTLTGLIKCQMCEKIYTNNKNLKRHMEMSHGEKGIFKCEICPKEYTSNQSLRRHTKSVHLNGNNEEYTCEYCYKIINGKNLDSHNAFCHKRLGFATFESTKHDYSCELCDMRYNKERLLRQHVKTTHTFQDFYEYCKKSLIKSTEKLEKNKKKKENCQLYSCEYCIQAYPTVYELKYHMRCSHDREYSLATCNVCFQKFFSKETIKEHRKTCVPPKNVNTCSHCDKLFTDISSLEFHTRIFHPQSQIADSITSTSEDVKESCHKCIHCNRIYYSERSLKHHLKLKHTIDDPVQCKLCDKICNNKYYLASHLKVVHNNESSSKCDYCDKEFKSKRNIRRHIEYTHLGMQRYKCVECETLFKEKRSLRKHVRVKHPNSTAFPQCHICEKRFESAKSCKTHLKLLHSFNMNTHPCDLCSVSFDSLDSLNIHLSTKHLAEDEIYKCQECNLVFKGQEQFGRHFETFHSNLLTVKKSLPRCIICMKDFSTRKTLKRHIKKFHNDFNVDELATYGSRRRVFNVDCGECIRNFNDDFYFGIYLKTKHFRESIIFKCESCKCSYNSLEFAIQRYKLNFDASQTKLYLSELCTTEMSDDSKVDHSETMEPESTTNDIKVETAEMSDDEMLSYVKVESDDDIKVFDEFSARYGHKIEPVSP
ncbi:zinc finger protein 600-like [Maniola hyperantus]|uniref:zinc finger protein 600-like n=1 Tax=Aphantopus hyperantus TaxID=2795564 RepID=UPI00156A53EE|nr:zinc finger protein 600-like [Maniola hyperantus]